MEYLRMRTKPQGHGALQCERDLGKETVGTARKKQTVRAFKWNVGRRPSKESPVVPGTEQGPWRHNPQSVRNQKLSLEKALDFSLTPSLPRWKSEAQRVHWCSPILESAS